MDANDYYLVNRDISMAIHDIQREPKRYQEAYSNLSRCMGLALPRKMEPRDAFYDLSVGCIGVGLGIIFIVISLYMVWVSSSRRADFVNDLPVALFVASMGMGLLIGLGHPHLVRVYLVNSHSSYTEYTLQQLITNGQIIDGEVLSAQKDGNTQRIEYRFTDTESHQTIEDFYVSSVDKSFPVGCRVAVLCLNNYAYILL